MAQFDNRKDLELNIRLCVGQPQKGLKEVASIVSP